MARFAATLIACKMPGQVLAVLDMKKWLLGHFACLYASMADDFDLFGAISLRATAEIVDALGALDFKVPGILLNVEKRLSLHDLCNAGNVLLSTGHQTRPLQNCTCATRNRHLP